MQSVVDTHSPHAPHAPGEPTIDSAAKQFKLICAGDERPIICSLSIVDQNEISVEEFAELDPEWKISFAVEVTPQMTTATAARLEAALDQGSVRILDASVSKDQTALSPVTQALLTELVTLWIDSTHSVQRTKISHRSTASTSSSSSVGSFPGPSCRRKLNSHVYSVSSSSASDTDGSLPSTPSVGESPHPSIDSALIEQSAALMAKLTRLELTQAEPKTPPPVSELDSISELDVTGERDSSDEGDISDTEVATVARAVLRCPSRPVPHVPAPTRAVPLAPTEEEEALKTPELALPVNAPLGVAEPTPDASTSPDPPAAAVMTPSMERGIPIAPVDENELTMRPWYLRWGRRKLTNFAMRPEIVVVDADAPAVILPFPPTTEEKYIYAQTRRVPLYIFGTLSFLSVSVGMWFFSISSDMFVWFIALGIIVQLYLIVSYGVGYTGRDYDLDNHRKVVAEFATSPGDDPSVDILLPVCKEPLDILVNTWKYVAQLSYTNFKVHVLDDGGLDSVKVLAEKFGFNYIRRENRGYLKKAGNLRHSFNLTSGDFFAIFDADFCPRHDFLQEILPLMRKEPDIAIVQTPQFFRPCDEQTWVEQGGSATQELFYRVIQVNRDHWGAAICVGSNAVYRREALKEVGGTAEIGHSEDVHTGFYALNRGWRLKYIPIPLACGISPDTAKAYFSQQMRWCSGSTTLLSNPEFWKSKLTIVQKLCFLTGMLFYTASAVLLLLNPLPALLMLAFQPGHILYYNFVFVIPALIDAFIIFRLWSRQRYNLNVNFVYVIQQYAYLMALKDKLFNTTAAWVPSGDTKAHEGAKVKGGNNKYRNSRILCAFWVYSTTAGAIVGSTFRILEGYAWYNYLPLMLLDSFTLVVTFRFIWSA